MMRFIDFVLKLPYTILHFLISCVLFIVRPFRIARLRTYFPEKKRKGYVVRYFDILKWEFKYKDLNVFYMLFGFDCKGSKEDNYLPERVFWEQSSKNNGLVCGNQYCVPGSQIFILRDKYAFYCFMKSYNISVPEVFCLLKNGKFYNHHMEEMSNEELRTHHDFFVKDLNGQCASFVKHINNFEDLRRYTNLKQGLYLLQESVHQSEKVKHINSGSVNTLRIVTINKNGAPYVLSSILRVGTKQTGNVDNWAAGGLAIGVNDRGQLAKYGFYKPKYGTKTDVHPDSGVIFADITLGEDYESACQLCCLAHKYLYNIHSIGWDVALTENGPVIIEGNDNWEISLMQACNGGLKDKWSATL